MNIDIDIPDNIRQIIEPHIGESLEDLAKEIITTRIDNLFKRFASRRSVGRPAVCSERHERSLARDLQKIFDNLKEMFPDGYETLYGAMDVKLKEAISKGDLATLEWFDKNKPWLTGGKV